MIKPKASFRGVGFYTIAHDTTVGRRQPIYSLPFQDKGAVAVDLGRAPRRFAITALVLGPDYAAQRDALIEALEQPGPGLLVHPTLGRVLVVIGDDIRITERTTATNQAEISFRATESAEKPPQVSPLDTASALRAAAAAGRLAAGASFENPVTGIRSGVSDFVRAANLDVLDDVIQGMASINGAISAVLAVPSGFAAQIDAISRQAANLLDTPRRLYDAIDGALESIAASTRRVLGSSGFDVDSEDVASLSLPLRRSATLFRAIAPMKDLGGEGPPIPPIDTQDRRDQLNGQLAIRRHMRASGLFNLADAAAEASFDTAADARRVRDALANALAELAESEPDLDAPLISALKAASASTMSHLSDVAGRLPNLVLHTPASTLPAEVVAYALYGDAERAEEIAARGNVKHPGFVPGSVEMEISAT